MRCSLRQLFLTSLSMMAMIAPAIWLRVWLNKRKGVQFGENAWVGVLSYIDIHRDHPDRKSSVVIGDGVAIGHFVMIFTHDSLYHQITRGREPVGFGRVVIGDYCNISVNAFLYNCTIGSHSIVAPHAVVVNSEFPPHSLIAGNPAKVVKDLRSFVEGP